MHTVVNAKQTHASSNLIENNDLNISKNKI